METPRGPSSHEQQISLRRRRCHFWTGFIEEHVHLTTHPEPSRQVDPGLDGKSHSRHECPIVRRFVVVEVRTRTLQLAVDGMAGTMREVIAEACLANDRASGVVDLGSGERLSPTVAELCDDSV